MGPDQQFKGTGAEKWKADFLIPVKIVESLPGNRIALGPCTRQHRRDDNTPLVLDQNTSQSDIALRSWFSRTFDNCSDLRPSIHSENVIVINLITNFLLWGGFCYLPRCKT